MKEEFKARFVSVTYKASFELLFHASIVNHISADADNLYKKIATEYMKGGMP
ncbi:MAG: hypothetical protein GY749_03330 [Desulfobacteraceae bacterium]|nr:hypothetical protein [Desulfobacteraceae bacterium]